MNTTFTESYQKAPLADLQHMTGRPVLGIEVSSDGTVTICDGHERLVNTSPHQQLGRLGLKLHQTSARIPIVYLFPRMPAWQSDRSGVLPAALKQMGGYVISRTDTLKLARRAFRIGSRYLGDLTCDAIVPMPSASDLVARTCDVLQGKLSGRPPILSILRKRSNREVLNLSPAVEDVSEAQRDLYQRECRRLNRLDGDLLFEAKRIPVRLRRHFPGLALQKQTSLPQIGSLLIVDDVISTGSSFPQRDKAGTRAFTV